MTIFLFSHYLASLIKKSSSNHNQINIDQQLDSLVGVL